MERPIPLAVRSTIDENTDANVAGPFPLERHVQRLAVRRRHRRHLHGRRAPD